MRLRLSLAAPHDLPGGLRGALAAGETSRHRGCCSSTSSVRPADAEVPPALEDKVRQIPRSSGSLCFPANFMPWRRVTPPRGKWRPHTPALCSRSPVDAAEAHRGRCGRIDIHVDVPRVDYDKLTGHTLGERSERIRARVEAAREAQGRRFQGTRMQTNADMGPAEVRQHCALDEAGRSLVRAAMQQLGLSARAYHRAEVGADGADWRGRRGSRRHIWQALQYRGESKRTYDHHDARPRRTALSPTTRPRPLAIGVTAHMRARRRVPGRISPAGRRSPPGRATTSGVGRATGRSTASRRCGPALARRLGDHLGYPRHVRRGGVA